MKHELHLQRSMIVAIVLLLGSAVLLPLFALFSQVFINEQRQFAGFSLIMEYLSSPSLLQSLTHTMTVAVMSSIFAVSLAFLYAYGVTRISLRGKTWLKYIALLPLFAPSMMHGIALTYLFGNQGVITTGGFGLFPGFSIPLYGPVGIIISEVMYTFPQAYLILLVSFAMADYRLYEAATTMGASGYRQFKTITLPSVKYGLLSALFVTFTLAFTDFGAPKIVGGNYNVLATDLYKYVIGQQNMSMGAVVGIVLLIPALAAWWVDRYVSSKQEMSYSSKAVPYKVIKNPLRDCLIGSVCYVISGLILLLMGTVAWASLVKVWPYDLTLSFKHYDFSKAAGAGMNPYWNSIIVSLWTAAAGTIITFLTAYAVEKMKVLPIMRNAARLLAIIPLALPGLVIGIAYILFFNIKGNPLHIMYGTISILVLANMVHFFSVSYVTASSALKKLDTEFESVSSSLGIPFYRTMVKVTVPMTLGAILEIGMYYFINSMVTISAVVFLYAADLKLASVAIVNMDDAGDVAPAAALSMLIVLTSIAVRLMYELITSKIRKKNEHWQQR
ncbi:iron(III) transport system permease protein [Paenibacillus aquistagni]|uniref:Iron(III) transport system permease protein n=1 Tax=Paenibacillus aquistagni TaxID=1852522 RepID=A0A1X7JC77_9BACL|nr:iron(III) transport system permease protein [Paenibacillus aquistagni]